MRYLIALGGNALDDNRAMSEAAKVIARLHAQGNQVVVTHGNGPQVGELAIAEHESLAVLTAQTQAWIGLNISGRISSQLRRLRVRSSDAIPEIMLTRTLVDRTDPAFRNPTKPIGKFYRSAEAARMSRKGMRMKKLINGYRRVVPSPEAMDIIGKETIIKLLGSGHIVIACGGGGIPVFDSGRGLHFADAVIDKDSASSLLARQIYADRFIILTNVDGVFINFKRRDERLLRRIRSRELEEYLDAGQFEQGSMSPKVRACLSFVIHRKRPASIGSMDRAALVALGRSGTTIMP